MIFAAVNLLRQYTCDMHVFLKLFLILLLSTDNFLFTENAFSEFSKVKCMSLCKVLNLVCSPKATELLAHRGNVVS